MRIDIVPFPEVRQDLVHLRALALGNQLVVAPLGPYLGRCLDEYLQLGVGKDGGADVASVHHNTFVYAHCLLLCH